MISEGIEIHVDELINEINAKLKRMHEILHDATQVKSEEELTNEMLTFSPEEWEQIAITIKHYQMAMAKLRSIKEPDEARRWFAENATFLGYLRDMVCAWESRLPARNKA